MCIQTAFLLLLAGRVWYEARILRVSYVYFLLTGAFFFLLGCHWVLKGNISYNDKHYSHVYNPGDMLSILLQKKVSEKNGRLRFRALVRSVGTQLTEGEIFVSIEADSTCESAFARDTIWTKSSLHEINPPRNPGAFDFKSYAAKKNIVHQIYLEKGSFILEHGKGSGLTMNAVRMNQNLQRVLEGVLQGQRERSIAKALLLGDRSDIPEDLLDRFKGAGAMHILAISGLHVGIIQLLLAILTRPLSAFRWGRGLRMIIVLSGLWGYALLTGFAVSAIRAVSMFTLLTIGQSLQRRLSLLNNLVNSAFVLLIINPLYLFDVGFQLSYSALLGIALGSRFMQKPRKRVTQGTRISTYFLGLIQVSCAAQIGVMPLSLFYFNQFSGVFLVSSLILLPVLGFTLLFGYGVIGASSLGDLPYFLTNALEIWLGALVKSIDWLGGLDELILEEVYFPPAFCVLTGLGLVMLTLAIGRRKTIYMAVFCFCLTCMQLYWIHQRIDWVRKEELLVFHIWGESLHVTKKGTILNLRNSKPISEKGKDILKDYSIQAPGSTSIQKPGAKVTSPIDLFLVGESLISRVDQDLGIGMLSAIDSMDIGPEVLILSNAPRTNLERLIKTIRPGIVVADGSNHKGFVTRCKATCKALGVGFHSTFEKGAFVYAD